jgi:hypothetical protein
MTTPPSFPTLAGLGWSVHKKPVFSTLVATHVSGREIRDPLYQNPIWQFELIFDALSSSPTSYPGAGANSLQALMGFFLQMQGQFGTFLYNDPTDSTATNVGFATGDGVTTTFTFSRFMGAFLEPVGWVTGVSNVFLNNVNQPSGWSLSAPNSLVFTTAPGLASRSPQPLRTPSGAASIPTTRISRNSCRTYGRSAVSNSNQCGRRETLPQPVGACPRTLSRSAASGEVRWTGAPVISPATRTRNGLDP